MVSCRFIRGFIDFSKAPLDPRAPFNRVNRNTNDRKILRPKKVGRQSGFSSYRDEIFHVFENSRDRRGSSELGWRQSSSVWDRASTELAQADSF
jgi:hypothetical protein